MELTRANPRRSTGRETLDGREFLVVHEAIRRLKAVPGATIPLFHAIQDALGYVPPAAVQPIAAALNISVADVHGVLTFYHYFRQKQGGAHVLHLCRAEACQALGARELEAHVKARLGVELHGTTSDGALSLEPVYCLGNCSLGPALMVDKTLHGRVTPESFDALADELLRPTERSA